MGWGGNGLSSENLDVGGVAGTQAFFEIAGEIVTVFLALPPLPIKDNPSVGFRRRRKSVSLGERRGHKACFLPADLFCVEGTAARCKSANGFEKPPPVLFFFFAFSRRFCSL